MSKNVEQELRVLKSGTCPSLSGKSKLTYEIGCGPASDLHVRLAKNSGTGYFSQDWVPWDRLAAVLDKNGKQPITCHTLSPLFKGLSVNTPGFLLAALKHEGLVQPSADAPRCYERTDPKAFYAELKALLDGSAVAPTKAAKAVKPVMGGRSPKPVAKKALRPKA